MIKLYSKYYLIKINNILSTNLKPPLTYYDLGILNEFIDSDTINEVLINSYDNKINISFKILQETNSCEPSIIFSSLGHDLMISIGNNCYKINLKNQSISSNDEFESVFYSFIPIEKLNKVLSIHETGVVCYSYDSFDEIWRVDTDLITSWNITDNKLELYLSDEINEVYLLESGVKY
ncbi:MAG: hypothetical protein COB02_15875 [Candidatus Cloacimonadota bacterium]|nr:MAG: hypothetical protein COB02_15875 [Candidatus Cloacimonadota bacterium]